MNKPVKILLTIFCILGIYSFLVSLGPKKTNGIFSKIKPIFTVENTMHIKEVTPTISTAPTTVMPATAQAIVSSIVFDGKSFSPGESMAKKDTTISFKNTSASETLVLATKPWQGTDFYSTVLKEVVVKPGGSFEFVANKAGMLVYYNYVESKVEGSINIVATE